MADVGWSPPGLDYTKPNIARVYDAAPGGKDNFAADREFFENIVRVLPESVRVAQTGRAFLHRVVRYLVTEAAVRQFIDIGSGLPTQKNVHEVAQALTPTARVVYVDNDPMVGAHGNALLANGADTAFVIADLRKPGDILNDATLRQLIDFNEPVGLLLLNILHHIKDVEDPAGIVAILRDAMPKGSYLAISSFRMPGPEHPEAAAGAAAVEKVFNEKLGTGRWRDDAEILAWFGDWKVINPGLVPTPEWRPDRPLPVHKDRTYYGNVGGVARKDY